MVATIDSSDVRLYLDGVEVDTIAHAIAIIDSTESVWFGTTGLSEDYEGLLDEISIYARALNPDEIEVLSGRATVNSTGDTGDATPGDGQCDTGGLNADSDPECTLRAAIEEANTSTIVDTIFFEIPQTDAGWSAGDTRFSIAPGTALPSISSSTLLDATTQSEWAGVTRPVIELDGSALSGLADGLDASLGTSTIRGFAIGNFPNVGIHASGGSGHVIAGNHVGLDATGTSPMPNFRGIRSAADGVVIGGSGANEANFISANATRGISIDADSNTIIGNIVGLDIIGTVGYSNLEGITVNGGATHTVVGGAAPGEGNVSSGNDSGIRIAGAGTSGTIVQGNIIGLDPTGTTPIPNAVGITFDNNPIDTLIGGTLASEANLISGNVGPGIRLASASTDDVAIIGNAIYGNGDIGIDLNLSISMRGMPYLVAIQSISAPFLNSRRMLCSVSVIFDTRA